jgi:ketosteroid isomerase-like protein
MTITRMLTAGALSLVLGQAIAASAEDSNGVIEQDRRLNQLIVAGDAKGAEAFYLDELVLTTSRGQSKSKQDMVTEIGNDGLHFDSNETADVVVHQHGDVAVLTGSLHQSGTYHDKAFDSTLRVTDTWLRTEKGWRLLAGHASAMP